MQKKNYSCGAAAIMSVSRYFGRGPEYEEDFIELLKKKGMNPRVGAHPYQLADLALKLNLKVKEHVGMTIGQIKSCLKKGRPVLMMLQAYGEDQKGRPLKNYRSVWTEGHWVVAIGYDKDGVFFEDPSLEAIRGYIPNKELLDRWHDVGPKNGHIENYGMEIWRGRNLRANTYLTRARYID
jgi:predicted double-glycine peptidase